MMEGLSTLKMRLHTFLQNPEILNDKLKAAFCEADKQ